MSMAALPWLEDDNPRDLLRWSSAAAVVVGVHAALIAGYLLWHQPDDDIGDDSSAVSVELAPVDSAADANQRDLAPGPEDMIEQKATPDADKQPDQPKPDQPPPPAATADVALPEQTPPEKVEEQRPPAPATTARVIATTKRGLDAWEASVVKHLLRYKNYPNQARLRSEEGTVVLSFSVDRDGHVLAHTIVRSSGHPDLDAEVIAMIERAQPLPAFPPSMTEARLDLTVPILFNLQ
jgi:protein TonB